jgi:endoglucanase
MKRLTVGFAVAVALITLLPAPPAAAQARGSEQQDWWNVPYPAPFDATKLPRTVSALHVEGNRFIDERGQTVVLQGVNISDPDKLDKNGRWSKAHFEAVKSWGARVVRVPVHPVAWKGRGPVEYFKLLDQAATWASELGLYLIVEWHAIGNLETGLFQHPMHETTKAETYQFWRGIAFRYGNVPAVAFYELFNEPTDYRGQLGRISWQQWKAINEEIIGVIRANGGNGIPLVGGFDWAYELRSVKEAPIEARGIGYVSHPYPMKAEQPWEANWERDFGYVADTYPVFATEIGFMAASDPGAHVPVMADEEYGRRVTAYFAKKGISWTAWCFDPDWPPQLISDWKYTPTREGAFFRDVMRRQK